MTPLSELIAYHREREGHCREEIDRAADFKDERQAKRSMKMWEEERRVARDTASWLETIRNQASTA